MIIDEWVPGTPEIPGTPTRYVELNAANWSSGSVSIPLTNGEGGYRFHVPVSVVGVFVGLASDYPGTGYFGIQHALYFNRGTVAVYERGQQVGTLGSYLGSDEFTLIQQAGKVWFLRNGIKEFDRPSRLSGTFRLASTQYVPGDRVVDAEVAPAATIPTSADGRATLGAFRAYGFDSSPGTWGVAELAPLEATASVMGHATGTATLGAFMAIGSDRPIAMGTAKLAGITSDGESGLLAPSYATAFAYSGPVRASGRSIGGGIGKGLAKSRILAGGSDRPVAQAWAELPPIFAWGGEGGEFRGAVMMIKGPYLLSATATFGSVKNNELMAPSATLEAYGGATCNMRHSGKYTLSATGTIPVVARASLMAPSATLQASATLYETISGDLMAPSATLEAYGGATCNMRHGGKYTLSATGTVGISSSAALMLQGNYPAFGEITVGIVMRGSMMAPALVSAPVGYAWLVSPAATMAASASMQEGPIDRESYVINLATGAVSRYTDFPFDRIHRFGNRHFGVRQDGIYELTGDTDNGAPISASVTTFATDFGTTNFKRISYVYLMGRFGGDMAVGVQVNEGAGHTFPAPAIRGGGVHALRAKIAQGIKGNAWSFTVSNVDGANFDIERIEALITPTSKAY